ncbi:hypothetical protein NPIL_619601 [Nephila pilipes]|uniref:Uncharacterized protein n=1 Tax=Nephila pilipes TaxID=299642 RepID=A0A8X6NT34_NEPPI|nr:hypothetical protein NPIL_619601 [Nephila pilipes]
MLCRLNPFFGKTITKTKPSSFLPNKERAKVLAVGGAACYFIGVLNGVGCGNPGSHVEDLDAPELAKRFRCSKSRSSSILSRIHISCSTISVSDSRKVSRVLINATG